MSQFLPALLTSFLCVGGMLPDDAIAATPRVSVTVVVILAGAAQELPSQVDDEAIVAGE
jgi:hypothetical protein